MATNNFKAFALDPNANVMSQADWEALPALLSGFTSGKAASAQVNKAIRQATTIGALIGQFIANSGVDALDNADVNGLVTKFISALNKTSQPLDATLTALAALATGTNKLPYFTGTDTASQTDLTPVGRDILGKTTVADLRTYLSLGSAALRDVGTGPANNLIPDMGSFIRSLASIGYQSVPGGLLLQWGTAAISGTGATAAVNYPIPFPTATFLILMCDTGGATTTYGTTNRTTSGFTAVRNITSGNTVGFYFALGN